jgi:hypothetical protein
MIALMGFLDKYNELSPGDERHTLTSAVHACLRQNHEHFPAASPATTVQADRPFNAQTDDLFQAAGASGFDEDTLTMTLADGQILLLLRFVARWEMH